MLFHGAAVLLVWWISRDRAQEVRVPFDLLMTETAREALSASALELEKERIKRNQAESKRAVFGVSPKGLQDGSSDVSEKAGNTVAKAPDHDKLRPGDAEALPIPTDEFLVTEMPKILGEVKIAYPPEARRKGVQGSVILDLLVDASGRVRDATVIEGPGSGLNEAAAEAVRRFEFKPAKVQERPVAVRIRYAYRFVLEK